MATDFIPHGTPPSIERVEVGARKVPALLVRPRLASQAQPLPAALIQHGYGAEKSDLLPLASSLVARGFVALLPDAWGHGERFPTSGPSWMTEITADYFMSVVRHTADDLTDALTFLAQTPDVRPDALVVGGFSMGAVAALVTGTEDPRVAGIISASGSPLTDLLPVRLFGSAPPSAEAEEWARAHDAVAHIAEFAPRPLLIQHGEADDMVPVSGSKRLYEAARPYYAEHPDRLTLMLYPHTHLVTEEEIEDSVRWANAQFGAGGESSGEA